MKPINLLMRALAVMALLSLALPSFASAPRHNFRTVPGDPLKTLIYTLPNGLQVFMTVNKERPRIQTYIAVRVGGKNDPAETTGLAHYFEHLMFKGTEKFGTSDYAAEKPLLDKIEALFETYRHTTDTIERKNIYRQIDSISYLASKIAIPNEYDKLMAAIGATGTNAYTSHDMTCYVEDIPSNQIENWAKVQADRFENPVLRGFHTELETIYEEKNMSLTNDGRKMMDAMLQVHFPDFPYGTQTVLGTQENLKNPSITNVRNYHKQWYVPNNMAIALSGDFDPDEMVSVIEKYFGHLKPNPNLPVLTAKPSHQITSPVKKEVYGKEAKNLYVTWRVPRASDPDIAILDVLSQVLSNGKTGLIDLNINQQQKVLGAGGGLFSLADGGIFLLMARPKNGQSLDEAKDILLAEIKNLRDGNFSDDLVPAIKANMKKYIQAGMESNSNRANYYVDAFINGQPWEEAVKQFSDFENITKDDIIRVANKYLGDNNYAAIYKLQGEDKNELKIAKPQLTPIVMNRDMASDFLKEIQSSQVKPIEPAFIDFDKDLTRLTTSKGLEVLYARNDINDLFSLTFIYDTGSKQDLLLGYASEVLDLYGTPSMTPEKIKDEFYKIACSYRVSVGDTRTYVVISGLDEYMPRALALYEELLSECVASPETYAKYLDRLEAARYQAKKNQQHNFSALRHYLTYGPVNSSTNDLSVDSLRKLDPIAPVDALRKLRDYRHRTIYYGKTNPDRLLSILDKNHVTAKDLVDAPTPAPYLPVKTDAPVVYLLNYPSKQLYYAQVSNTGETYNPEMAAIIHLYNNYFGGSMNSIVFQEMRESRSLAYSAGAGYNVPYNKIHPYTYTAFIATQNDKMGDAISAFDQIINDMPLSESAFQLAKQSIDSNYRTSRTLHDDIAWSYISALDHGLNYDNRKENYERNKTLTLDDIVRFQKYKIKGRTYNYAILGQIDDLDMDTLRKLGQVIILTPEQVFGF